MKPSLKFGLIVGALMMRLLVIGTETAIADDQPGDGKGQMLSSLSMQDKMKLMKARKQVLANNADLKSEQEDLTKQREALKDQGSNASPEDRKALLQNFMAHEKKMKAAMLQVDPSLQPVFDQIEQQMKQKMAQRTGQGGGN